MESCYAFPSRLYCGDHVLASERGVQQGDPCGPAGFAWAIQDLAEDLAPYVTWQAWYLDDAHILGTPLQLHQTLQLVLSRCAALGLELNLGKCQVWGPAFSTADGAQATLPLGTPEDSALRRVTVTPFGMGSGIKALGVPVCHPAQTGPAHFASSVWDKRLREARKALEMLVLLPQAHVQLTLLRHTLDSCKVNDLLRSTPLHQGQQHVLIYSRLLRDCLSSIVGCQLSDQHWEQATLPARLGGLGIRDPTAVRLPARIASAVDYGLRAQNVLGLPSELAPLPLHLENCLAQAATLLGNCQPLQAWLGDKALVLTADKTHSSQSWWGDLFAVARRDKFASLLTGVDAARFASQRQPHAMAWVSVIPSAGMRTLLPSVDMKCLLRWSLGVPLLPPEAAATPPVCPKCDGPMDSDGHHLVCCPKNGFTRRHAAVQQFLLGFCQRSGFAARREQGGTDRTRPGDVFITRLDANGPCAVDVTVHHTLAPSHPLRGGDGSLTAWQEAEAAKKKRKYLAQCKNWGWSFCPFVLDCYGALAEDGRALMATILRFSLAQREGWERRGVEADAWQGLSLALMREVGAQLRASRYLLHPEENPGPDDGPLFSHNPYALS